MTNSSHNPIPESGDGPSCSGSIPPIDRVEWSRKTILDFIEDYRGYRVLWDPNTKGYHIKQVKYEALRQLGSKYSSEVRVIRSKIKSLRSSFHREHGKVINGVRRGIQYQPMWFAYEAIRFILDGERNEMKGALDYDYDAVSGGDGHESGIVTSVFADIAVADTVSNGIDAKDELTDQCLSNSHYANISAADVKTEIHEGSSEDPEDITLKVEQVKYNKLISKRERRACSKHAAISIQKQTDSFSDDLQCPPSKLSRQSALSRSDEFGVFGNYVGMTIRKLKTSKAQVVIKHLINNLLYEAELGKYDDGMPTSKDPPHLYATGD